MYDLPFGKRGSFFKNSPSFVNAIIGGWTTSGVFRLIGSNPLTPTLTDTNRLGGVQYAVRLDRVEGVPIINPLYSSDCSMGGACEPYINPAAFKRPAKGSLGTVGRGLDIRGPMQQYFDFSIQKTFELPFLGKEARRRLNFRVDLLNAFNHPVLRMAGAGTNANSYGGLPNEANLTQAELNTWLAANPGQTATLAQVNQILIDKRVNNVLPLDFFSVAVPQGFATRQATSFDIRTLEGLKHFRLRQAYNQNFGTLGSPGGNARYIQFGIRFFF